MYSEFVTPWKPAKYRKKCKMKIKINYTQSFHFYKTIFILMMHLKFLLNLIRDLRKLIRTVYLPRCNIPFELEHTIHNTIFVSRCADEKSVQ